MIRNAEKEREVKMVDVIIATKPQIAFNCGLFLERGKRH